MTNSEVMNISESINIADLSGGAVSVHVPVTNSWVPISNEVQRTTGITMY
jgi:hypothetical protein